MMDYTETLCAAIAIFGREMQQIVAMEELGELIQEISKQLRGKGNPEHSSVSSSELQAIRKWDEFVTPIREKYGIPVYRPGKGAR